MKPSSDAAVAEDVDEPVDTDVPEGEGVHQGEHQGDADDAARTVFGLLSGGECECPTCRLDRRTRRALSRLHGELHEQVDTLREDLTGEAESMRVALGTLALSVLLLGISVLRGGRRK